MDFLLEPIQESFYALPLLFIACLLIEYMSSKNVINKILEYGKLGPMIGAILGCIPQCGFSVLAARLYSMKYITMGTILSIFMATSDEAISIMIIHPEIWKMLILLIIIKVILGATTGLIVDYFNSKKESDYEYIQIEDCTCGCTDNIFIPAIKHTLKIFAFILLTNIIMTLIIEGIGEDQLALLLNTHKYLQPLISGIIGFIPNCAGSVILTQLYVSNGLTFGALLTGLTTSAGVGTLALISYNKEKKDTIKILLISYIVAIIIGYIFSFIL